MNFRTALLICACIILSACSAEYSAIYQNVNADSKWDETARIVVEYSKQELPPYVVKDNELYLMIRNTRSDWYFHTVVSYPSWDRPEIDRVISSHSGVAKMIPIDWNNWLPRGFGDECKGRS